MVSTACDEVALADIGAMAVDPLAGIVMPGIDIGADDCAAASEAYRLNVRPKTNGTRLIIDDTLTVTFL